MIETDFAPARLGQVAAQFVNSSRRLIHFEALAGHTKLAATYENRNTAAAIAQVQRWFGPQTAAAVIERLSMMRLLCS